jgi:hypothetical protein
LSEQTTTTDEQARDAATGRFYREVTDSAMRGDPEPNFLETLRPMPEAPKEEPEKFGSDAGGLKQAARELQQHRAASSPPIERQYLDTHSGEPRPENETITAERGARDLADLRRAEFDAAATKQGIELQRDVDRFRGQPTEQQLQPVPEPVPQPAPQPQNKIQVALADPEIRSAIEQQVAQSEQARQAYANAIQQTALTQMAAGVAAFPELAQLQTPEQLEGGLRLLAQQNPQRFQQVQDHFRKMQAIGERAREFQRGQQRENVARFAQWGAAQDAEFDKFAADKPAEEVKAVRAAAADTLASKYGIGRQELATLYNTNPILRSAPVQKLIYDLTKFHLAQEGIRRVPSVPPVFRPGVDGDHGNARYDAAAELAKSFRADPNPRNAAKVLAARRRAAAQNR